MPLSRSAKFVRIEVEGGLQHHYQREGKWDHPAGKIEPGETPRQAAHRELIERTGYSAETLQRIGKEGNTHVYRASKVTRVGPPQTKIRWRGLSSVLDDLIQFDLFSDSVKLYKHLKAKGIPVTRGNIGTGYFNKRLVDDFAKSGSYASYPKTPFINIERGYNPREMGSQLPVLWHEAGHKFRLSSQVHEAGTAIRELAGERGANRQAMKLADELQASPETKERLRRALKISYRGYKNDAFRRVHWGRESSRSPETNEAIARDSRKFYEKGEVPSFAKLIEKYHGTISEHKRTLRANPWLGGFKFSAARDLFNKVIEFGWIDNTKSLLRDLRKHKVQIRRHSKNAISYYSPAGQQEWRPLISVGRGDHPVFALHHEGGHDAARAPIDRYFKSRNSDNRVRWELLAERMANRSAIKRMDPDMIPAYKKQAKKWYAGHYDASMSRSYQPDIIQTTGANAFAARNLFNKVIEFTTISATKNMIRKLRKHGVHIPHNSDRRLLWSDAKESVGRFDPDPISIAVTKGKGARGIFWHEAGHALDEIKNHPSVEMNKVLEAAKAKDYFDNPFSDFHKLKRKNEIMANHYAQQYMQRYNVPAKNIKQWRKQMAPSLNSYRAANFNSVLDNPIQFKTLYQPGEKDAPPETLPELQGLVDYTVQRHAAKRAGKHRDIRIGNKRHGLQSWATRKELPSEGGRIGIHPQPVHPHSYLGWEGNIPGGYGAGDVSTEHLGKALVTKSTPEELHATLSDQKEHHRLALVKTPKGWLMTRGKHPEPPKEAQKPKYKSVSQEDAPEHLESIEPGTIVQPKLDGALVYITTKGNRPEVFSHRKGKHSGRNIIHTERVFHGRPITNIPKEHQRTLIGELYGTRRGKAIEPQELGGILNTHLGESITKQKKRGVKLRIMPFDYANGKGEPYPDRLAKVKQTLEHLPGDIFHPPEEAHTPKAARKLYEKIRKGKHPLTKEGVIAHPPTGRMVKIKNVEEANVPITGTYPGTGKFEGSHGGFTYEGGNVGTGFTDETRRKLHEYVGRTARIRHQGKYPSGAYRAPAFIGIDENK